MFLRMMGREETPALVQAMESRVEVVRLDYAKTLDIETLTKYSGLGACRRGQIDRYCEESEELDKWATSRNWIVDVGNWKFILKRI